MLNSIGHWEGFGRFSIVQGMCYRVLKLTANCNGRALAIRFSNGFPKHVPADGAEGPGPFKEVSVEIAMQSRAFLLNMAGGNMPMVP